VDWATDLDIDSPTAKFILLLLANKADENFSCFPSVSTLMAESSAGRSTVLRALKKLEVDGYITRKAQFHDSGAQRASRYYLSHPLAPHLAPRPNPEAPRSRCDTGPVPRPDGRGVISGPHGGVRSGLLEPHNRTTNRTTIRRANYLASAALEDQPSGRQRSDPSARRCFGLGLDIRWPSS
jgi:DNA-binding transcriptional MocR family regulator